MTDFRTTARHVLLTGIVLIASLVGPINAAYAQFPRALAIAEVNPVAVQATVPTAVTVVVNVLPDPALLPTSVTLVRYNESQRVIATLGRMYDDGTHGDAVALDNRYALTFQLTDPAPGITYFGASAAYRGSLLRVQSTSQRFITSAGAVAPAHVDALVPGSGPSGTLVQLVGTNFLPTAVVSFSGMPAETVYISDTSIAAIVPFAIDGDSVLPLNPQVATVAIDGVALGSFEVTGLPISPDSPGTVLSDTLAALRADLIASEADLRSSLAETAATIGDPASVEYVNALAALITPVQTLLESSEAELTTALDADSLTLLDRALLGAQGDTVNQLAAARGIQLQAVLDGDQWLLERKALADLNDSAEVISTVLNVLCKYLKAGHPQLRKVCDLAGLAIDSLQVILSYRLGLYGGIEEIRVNAPRNAVAGATEIRIEAYPTMPMVLSAAIRTQQKLNFLEWIITILRIPLARLTLVDIDPKALTAAESAKVGQIDSALSKLAKAAGFLDLGKAPVVTRPVSFIHLSERPLLNVLACVPVVGPDGSFSVQKPLANPISCAFGIDNSLVVLTEGLIAYRVTLFTPALEVAPQSLTFIGFQGTDLVVGLPVTLRAFAEPGVPANLDLVWNVSPEGRTLAGDRVGGIL